MAQTRGTYPELSDGKRKTIVSQRTPKKSKKKKARKGTR